ncbi:cytochrome b5 [Basidiobolus meristosporus CBS 931.73]|uniref:Cytochrome b5 n=1 Tax=Basidiobolus meristosporus CBS 931.73 TaxID=1314790 RepID=A0A1Y1Y193_9FUNG|nr:cytochrome b5 [Basidiobolus meristosporus CBS 931.73]|eukprot:ORX91782.1 cytochrome b5 [Basidiobolus meristosporus CBS 931.73]
MSELTQRKVSEKKPPSAGAPSAKPSAKPAQVGKIIKDTVNAILISIAIFFVASYIVTETFTWGVQNKYTNWRNWIPRKKLLLSEAELSRYNGEDPNLPIYIALDGEVYDVTAGGGFYTKGGSYGFFSGRDAARAFVTGCFETHLTHDLRGLSKEQLKGLQGWKEFYENHHTYYHVGQVVHPPIDPKSPIPPDCKQGSSYNPNGKA